MNPLSSTLLQGILGFYHEQKRMPSYSEIALIGGFSSKESAYRHVQNLIHAGKLVKDSTGKLLAPEQKKETPHSKRVNHTLLETVMRPIKMLGFVEAGFPSDSDGDELDSVSLDEWLLKKPDQTFILRVKGDSMIDAGIYDGDHVLVEKTQTAKPGDIVVARLDGGYTLKYLRTKNGKYYLEAANREYRDMHPRQELSVEARLQAVIRTYK